MSRRRALLCAALIAAVSLAFFGTRSLRQTPGRILEQRLMPRYEKFFAENPAGDPAVRARAILEGRDILRDAGTNGLQCLALWVREFDQKSDLLLPSLRFASRHQISIPFQNTYFTNALKRALLAQWAFAIAGTNGAPVLPQLQRMATRPTLAGSIARTASFQITNGTMFDFDRRLRSISPKQD